MATNNQLEEEKVGVEMPVLEEITTPTSAIATEETEVTETPNEITGRAVTATAVDPVVERGTSTVPTEESTSITTDRNTITDLMAKQSSGQGLSDLETFTLSKFQSDLNLGRTPEQIFGEEDTSLPKLATAETARPGDIIVSPGATEADIQREKNIRELGVQQSQAISEEISGRRQEAETSARRVAKQREDALKNSLSFSGFGRSTVGVERLDDIQRETQSYINQVNAKLDAEEALRKAEVEGATEEQLGSLRESVIERTKLVNELEGDMLKTTEELNKKLKVSGDEAYNNIISQLVENRKITGEEPLEVDESTSKLVGYLADKFGNPINVGGKAIKLDSSLDTKVDPETINAFANSVLSGEKITSVPTSYRGAVLKRIASKKDQLESTTRTLTPLETLRAKSLAKEILGVANDTTAITAIESMLLDGKTIDEIKRDLTSAGYTKELGGAIKSAFESATTKGFTGDQKESAELELNRRVEQFGVTSPQVKEYILGLATDKADAETRKKVLAKVSTIAEINKIKQRLDDYIKAGGNTNLLEGTLEDIQNKVGATGNPELATIANDIALSVQAYRQMVSGAAFSESEAKEYERIFPSSKNTIALNKAKIDSLINTFGGFTNQYYRQALGNSAYQEIFPDGVMDTFAPGINDEVEPVVITAETYTSELSEVDKVDFVRRAMRGEIDIDSNGGASLEFIQEDDKAEIGDIFGDFKEADQPAITKAVEINGQFVNITKGNTNRRPDRNNNPGNVKSSPVNQSLSTKTDDQGHLIFDTPEQGLQALSNDLFAKLDGRTRNVDLRNKVQNGTATLKDLNRAYAEDPNWGAGVAKLLGIDENTKLSEINRYDLLRVIPIQEGFTGKIEF